MQAGNSTRPGPPFTRWGAIAANACAMLIPVTAGVLHGLDSALYYRAVQEDEVLGWGTFWAFVLSAAGFGVAAWRARGLAWFEWGLALFCLVVAMEEISWGQRVVGYRPPTYFLEHNFQQELNLHNVLATDLRKLALSAIILGYGVALPLIA